MTLVGVATMRLWAVGGFIVLATAMADGLGLLTVPKIEIMHTKKNDISSLHVLADLGSGRC